MTGVGGVGGGLSRTRESSFRAWAYHHLSLGAALVVYWCCSSVNWYFDRSTNNLIEAVAAAAAHISFYI